MDRCYHPTGVFIRFEQEDVGQSITSRFEQQVSRYPSYRAIKTDVEELTYNDLNQAANHVSRVVIEQAGTGEERIALLFEQGVQVIIAIFGVLKAGMTLVPLDPLFPTTRTRYIVNETQPRLILTNTPYVALAEVLAGDGCHVINIDDLDFIPSADNLQKTIPPDAIASIVYTSGSSGQPKGVIDTHRNTLHAVMGDTNLLHICALDRLTALYTPSGAPGTRDTFRALLNGATICPFDLKSEGMGKLAGWLMRTEITIYHSTPTGFRHFVAGLSGEEEFPKLRHIFMSGEPVYNSDVELYARYFFQDCVVANAMGSTEAHNYRWYLVDQDARLSGMTVPLGYDMLDGLKVVLLDEDSKEVGYDQIGQIAVKSRYLSLGYWRRPDLTQDCRPSAIMGHI